jgi:hypothetical protein
MGELKDKNKVVFIIAHKYVRGYQSYIEYYIRNIKKFYQDSLVIVVDNNSKHKEDVFGELYTYENVILLENNKPCKFEIGAYQVGLEYMIDHQIYDNYDYVVLSQDTFVIKNRLDFNELHQQNITACPINTYYPDGMFQNITNSILSSINLLDNLDKITFCWCNTFIVSSEKVNNLYGYIKDIIITVREESCASERYLARIIYELNNHKNNDIDGDIRHLGEHWDGKENKLPKYDCHSVDPINDNVVTYFVKRTQQKTERTIE